MSTDGGYQGSPQVRDGRRGDLGGRGYYRAQEGLPRHETWHEDNLYEDYRDNPNVGQAYHGGYNGNQQGDKALDKIKNVVPTLEASTYKSWPKKEDTPKMAFKDHFKPKVEEKERLITNPTRCFKCNGMGHIAINFLAKKALVLSEDLNGWIEKSENGFQEGEDFRMNLLEGGAYDVNRKSQAPLKLKLGPLTRARMKKLKIHDANVDNRLVVYMEEALKNKLEGFEDKGKASKFLSICKITKDHSRE
ncbi:hypothetical protein M9H77_17798 [Catharanthus roseus]|uniref:Uncharacterized protein n=1 Tax=Catharanthus roseus TaxID=4058 RepID=A0ACC0B5L6_CATRO|nr:hypothetical protein M9H77_17798 [Catharanthus roseus]